MMTDLPTLKVGDEYPVWWFTGKKVGSWNYARVLEINNYQGKYPEHFTAELKLAAPNTKRGWMEMAV